MRKFFWLMGSFIFLPLTAIADEGTDTSAVTQTTESIEAVVSTETIDSTVSTTETSTVETTQSSEEVTTQPEEVVEAIVAQTGVPASDEAEDITEQSDIRASFTKGIEDGSVTAFTQAELDQLTDQQLKDAETLALRYS
jgi:cytoskeletal protein RodZ